MNKFNSFQVFQQVSCRIVGHEDYNANIICIEKECQQQKLLCFICYQTHKTHKLLQIQQVQEYFKEFKKSTNTNVILIRLKKMLDDFETFSINKLKELINDLKKLLEFQNLMENSFLNNKQASYTELKSQINQFLSYFEITNQEKIQLKNIIPSDIFLIIDDRLKKYQYDIHNFWKNNVEFIENGKPQQLDSQQQRQNQQPQPMLQNQHQPLQQPLEIQKIPLQQQLGSFQFSEQFCSNQIKCITPKCVRKTAVNSANDVACLNQPLSPYEKKSFVFRVNKKTQYVGIGISILQVIKPQNFFFRQLNEIGHGVFMVLNNRVVYNHNYPIHNRITGQVDLQEGQKYRLTFDPQNKNGKQFNLLLLSEQALSQSMPMLIDETLDYHVFVHIGDKDGEIELLNEI